MQPVKAEVLLKGLCPAPRGSISAVITDSRRAEPGCVFVCFAGERADGHDFAAQVVEKGAAYVIGTRPAKGVPPEKMLVVPHAGYAMVEMAANYRAQFSPKLIGVTGSVGKTTTKEFCAAALQLFGPSIKTEGNQNNEIGMPNTLFQLTEDTRYGVVEMGMNHLGEIRRLARAARPSAGIITCIGVSHLENLGSRENILKAKLELCEGLPPGAPLVLNRDDPLLRAARLPGHVRPLWVSLTQADADVWAEALCTRAGGESFILRDAQNGSFPVQLPVLGRHCVRDALQAYAAAVGLGLEPARVAKGLENYQATGLRQHMISRGGIALMLDCYNASPDSMQAAFETFRQVPGRRRLALLGDMLELGDYTRQAHEELGVLAAKAGLDLLFVYGQAARDTAAAAAGQGLKARHFTDREEAAQALADCLRAGDALLVKGSRGMQLEKLIERMWAYREPPA